MCNTDRQTKFKISMVMSTLCDYSDVYKGTVENTGSAAAPNNIKKSNI